MHPCLKFLDEAIRMAEEELLLLENDNLEDLESCAQARSDLIQRAWQIKDGCDTLTLAGKLTAMQRLQHELQQRAEAVMRETRSALLQNKKNQQGILGYCRTGLGRLGSEARMFRKFF